MKKNLVLLGMMAVGKSTLGKIVAKKLRLQFIDTDKNIENHNLMKIKDYSILTYMHQESSESPSTAL